MLLPHLALVLGLHTLTPSAPAARATAVARPPSPFDEDASLPPSLDENDLPDSSDQLTTDVDRWVLHDVWTHGIAQSGTWSAKLARRHDLGFADDSKPWTQKLGRHQAELAMRGEPQQHHPTHALAARFDIPTHQHALVDLYIDYFTGRGRWFFARWLQRAALMEPLMRSILAEQGLPQDLVYVAMVESGFSSRAYSSAAASGYWQFIPSTGLLYGLSQTRFVDERRDFVRSTQAAGRFLQALHRQFGDWHLAWASYNAGPARIERAMARTHARTFWELIARDHGLAKETVHYVPKIIAAAIIAKDAARFGFEVTTPSELTYQQVAVDGALDLRVLAKKSGISIETLQQLNPSLLYAITPPRSRWRLRVPTGTGPKAQQALAALPVSQRLATRRHVVRAGDKLSTIARQMHAAVGTLRQFNQVPGDRLRIGQELIVPTALPASFAMAPRAPASRRSHRRAPPARPRPMLARATIKPKHKPAAHRLAAPKRRHVVAAGDTLWGIARRYGVSLEALRRAGRKSQRLAVGDVVDIF